MKKVILIDVDNTLYPRSEGVFDIINAKIHKYMKELLNLNDEQIENLRISYFSQYGSSLAGLIKDYNVDPEHFLKYVHDVDIRSKLKPNKQLKEKLRTIDAVKIAFTNAPIEHAQKVLESLGVIDQFIEIFDIYRAHFIGKPNMLPYKTIVKQTKADKYAMVDDQKVNLLAAKQLNMFIVLISEEKFSEVDMCIETFKDIPNDII